MGIKKDIDELRQELHTLIASGEPINEGKALKISMELDGLINQYHKQLLKETKKSGAVHSYGILGQATS